MFQVRICIILMLNSGLVCGLPGCTTQSGVGNHLQPVCICQTCVCCLLAVIIGTIGQCNQELPEHYLCTTVMHALQSASPHDEQCLLAWDLGILTILDTCMTTGMK